MRAEELDPPGQEELIDLPLSAGAEDPAPASPRREAREREALAGSAAPLLSRWAGFAADAALVILLVAVPVLAATAGRGDAPRLAGLVWAAVFAVYLSFFATFLSLILFGRTVGMALTGLSARASASGPLTAAESARRWAGTALAAAGLGLPILFARRDAAAPSLADRLSGRPLVVESNG